VNVSPAIAIFGDATTWNAQGNGNTARTDVGQSNAVTQSQSATQNQNLGQSGGSCCKPRDRGKPPENGCKPAPHGDLKGSAPCSMEPWGGCRSPKDGQVTAHDNRPSCMPMYPDGKTGCCNGRMQMGSQSASFGDQSVGKQKNDADVTQTQGNENANASPALGTSGKKQHRSRGPHAKKGRPGHGGAATSNAQGNGNVAKADVDQGNMVDQSQVSRQSQSLDQSREGVSLL
jgi:hypothetical protein